MPHPKKDWELRKNVVPANKNRSRRTDINLRFYEKRPNQCLSDWERNYLQHNSKRLCFLYHSLVLI